MGAFSRLIQIVLIGSVCLFLAVKILQSMLNFRNSGAASTSDEPSLIGQGDGANGGDGGIDSQGGESQGGESQGGSESSGDGQGGGH